MSPLVAGLVLAAGASTRMGRPKALLPWGETTLLAYVTATLAAAGVTPIVVVVGPHADEVRAALPLADLRLVVNAAWATGRASSVRAGAAALPDGVAVIVQAVDNPVPPSVIHALVEAAGRGALLAVPSQGGRRGHPILFGAALLPELRQVEEASAGLRAVVGRHLAAREEVAVASEAIHWNLNDPAAYAACHAAYRAAVAAGTWR